MTFSEQWRRYWREIHETLTGTKPPRVPVVLKTALPSAEPAGQLVYVSNEAGGAVLAFSDGTNWRRVTDRAVVS